MKALLTVVLLGAAALPCRAADAGTASVVSQDPLMRQIQRRLMQSDAGISAVTWVQGPSGERVAIPLLDANSAAAPLGGAAQASAAGSGALRPLAPARGLVSPRQAAAHQKAPLSSPAKQLRRIEERKGWAHQ
jgi:hypothetical protein